MKWDLNFPQRIPDRTSQNLSFFVSKQRGELLLKEFNASQSVVDISAEESSIIGLDLWKEISALNHDRQEGSDEAICLKRTRSHSGVQMNSFVQSLLKSKFGGAIPLPNEENHSDWSKGSKNLLLEMIERMHPGAPTSTRTSTEVRDLCISPFKISVLNNLDVCQIRDLIPSTVPLVADSRLAIVYAEDKRIYDTTDIWLDAWLSGSEDVAVFFQGNENLLQARHVTTTSIKPNEQKMERLFMEGARLLKFLNEKCIEGRSYVLHKPAKGNEALLVEVTNPTKDGEETSLDLITVDTTATESFARCCLNLAEKIGNQLADPAHKQVQLALINAGLAALDSCNKSSTSLRLRQALLAAFIKATLTQIADTEIPLDAAITSLSSVSLALDELLTSVDDVKSRPWLLTKRAECDREIDRARSLLTSSVPTSTNLPLRQANDVFSLARSAISMKLAHSSSDGPFLSTFRLLVVDKLFGILQHRLTPKEIFDARDYQIWVSEMFPQLPKSSVKSLQQLHPARLSPKKEFAELSGFLKLENEEVSQLASIAYVLLTEPSQVYMGGIGIHLTSLSALVLNELACTLIYVPSCTPVQRKEAIVLLIVALDGILTTLSSASPIITEETTSLARQLCLVTVNLCRALQLTTSELRLAVGMGDSMLDFATVAQYQSYQFILEILRLATAIVAAIIPKKVSQEKSRKVSLSLHEGLGTFTLIENSSAVSSADMSLDELKLILSQRSAYMDLALGVDLGQYFQAQSELVDIPIQATNAGTASSRRTSAIVSSKSGPTHQVFTCSGAVSQLQHYFASISSLARLVAPAIILRRCNRGIFDQISKAKLESPANIADLQLWKDFEDELLSLSTQMNDGKYYGERNLASLMHLHLHRAAQRLDEDDKELAVAHYFLGTYLSNRLQTLSGAGAIDFRKQSNDALQHFHQALKIFDSPHHCQDLINTVEKIADLYWNDPRNRRSAVATCLAGELFCESQVEKIRLQPSKLVPLKGSTLQGSVKLRAWLSDHLVEVIKTAPQTTPTSSAPEKCLKECCSFMTFNIYTTAWMRKADRNMLKKLLLRVIKDEPILE